MTAAGDREVDIYKVLNSVLYTEGVSIVAVNSGTVRTVQQVTTQARLVTGDYVELGVFQDSGSTLSISPLGADPVFAMHWVTP